MIDLENVKKSYATGVQALNGISLHIDRGEFVHRRRQRFRKIHADQASFEGARSYLRND